METKPKVIIAIPCSDAESMKVQTAHAIGASIIGAGGLVVNIYTRQSADIVSNRTWLVQQAIKDGATHILFVDCDMFFPADTIPRLLSHNKEIVGVEYYKRKFPKEPVFEPYSPLSKVGNGIYKAAYVGTGLLLIDLSVFSKFTGPFFNFGRDREGRLVLGEDVWFCRSAQDLGYDVWIDPSLKIAHIGSYMY